MSGAPVRVLELTAWGMDASSYRATQLQSAPERLFTPLDPLLPQSDHIRTAFAELRSREDLLEEMMGLVWSLEMVDLRRLLTFQRRLTLDPGHPPRSVPQSDAELLALAFGPVRKPSFHWLDESTLQSANPDLQLRPSASGWHLHGGSPFLEVTLWQDRAFLRDGYHRAYDLLRAGIYAVPAVVIYAQNALEICPADSWFMPQDILLGSNPPLLTDFLDPALTLTYERPQLLKTIHLSITESMEPER